MPPNVLAFRSDRSGPPLFHARHCSTLGTHDRVSFVAGASEGQPHSHAENSVNSGVSGTSRPGCAAPWFRSAFGPKNVIGGTCYAARATSADRGGVGASHTARGVSFAADRIEVGRYARAMQVRDAAGSELAAAPAPAGRPSPLTLRDRLLAVVILNLVGVAAWALVAFPLLREIAIGSVTALPWWLWAGFAVLMGGIAGGQVR